MKNILCLIIILFAGLGAYAQQEKALTATEFDALYKASFDSWSLESWKGKAFRRTVITHSSVEGRPQTDYSSKTTIEYASPTNNRAVYESSLGGKKTKTESIRSDGKVYFRKDDGNWQESAPRTTAEPEAKAETKAPPASEQVEYKFIGTEKLNDRIVNVYVRNAQTKRINSADGKESLTTSVTKFWFDKNGALLKSDMTSETREGEKIYRTLLTQLWESDETIKIIAPTLSGKQD